VNEMQRQAASYLGQSRNAMAPGSLGIPAIDNELANLAARRVGPVVPSAPAVPSLSTATQRDILSRATADAYKVAPMMGDESLGFFTPAQISQFAADPDSPLYEGLMGSRRINEVQERLLGGAVDEGVALGQIVNPYDQNAAASEALRTAMYLSGYGLMDSYKIDPAEVELAMATEDADFKLGDTAFDMQTRRQLGTTLDEQREQDIAAANAATQEERSALAAERADINFQQSQQDRAADQAEAGTEEASEQAAQQFLAATGVPVSAVGSGYNATDLRDLVASDAYTQALAIADAAAQSGDDVEQALIDGGYVPSVPQHAAIFRILRALYGG
jgi:hypothetical protein